MDHALWKLLQNENALAFLAAATVFFVTVFLVAKKWINFSFATLLLLFAIVTGLVIRYQDVFIPHPASKQADPSPAVPTQFLQAFEDLKIEVDTDKDHLNHIMDQVQDIFSEVNAQKLKLQHFIEETRERFHSDLDRSDKPEIPSE